MADELDVTTIKHMTHGYKDRTLVVFSICYPVAVVAVALRFLSRSMVKNGYWWDDWLAVIALTVTGGFCACTLACLPSDSVLDGEGPVDPALAMYNTKGSYAAELFYYINQATLKLSILALYWRVFSSANYINISIKYIGGYVIIWFIASFIVAALQCVPVQAIWDPVAKMEPGVRCVNLNAFFFGTSVPNIVADLVLVLLPTPQVLQLKITTTQKVFVIFFFLLGGFVVITSIVRLRLLLEVEFESFPYNWSMEDSVVWTIVENCCGVISICLPTLRPIMRVMPWKSIQNAFTRSYGATGASRSGTNMGNSAFNHPSRQGYWSEIRSTNDGSVGPSGIQKDTQVDVVSIEMHPTRDSSPGRFGGSTV